MNADRIGGCARKVARELKERDTHAFIALRSQMVSAAAAAALSSPPLAPFRRPRESNYFVPGREPHVQKLLEHPGPGYESFCVLKQHFL